MVFDNLRSAVNNTHGSLHQAFLAWDKNGSGELTKARLRVGLRGCRGANERDVEMFMSDLFSDDQMERVSFNRLFQAFHEGEKRFAEDDLDIVHPINNLASIHRMISSKHPIKINNISVVVSDDDEVRKKLISTNSPERVLGQEASHANTVMQQGGSTTSTTTMNATNRYRTPPRNEEGTPKNKRTPMRVVGFVNSPTVDRRLDFDVEDEEENAILISPQSTGSTNSTLRTSFLKQSPGRQQQFGMKGHSPEYHHHQHDIVFPLDSSKLSSTSPSRPSSPSSARFQRIREARRSSPFRNEDYHFNKPMLASTSLANASSPTSSSSNISPSSPMFDLAERKLFESRAGQKASSSPFQAGRSSSISSSSGNKFLPRKTVIGYQQRVRTSLLDDLSINTPEKTLLFGANASGMHSYSNGNLHSGNVGVGPHRSNSNESSDNEQQYLNANKDSYVFDRFMQPSQTSIGIQEKDKLFEDDGEEDIGLNHLLSNKNSDKLNPTIRNELKVMLMTMAKDTPSSPIELVISPSDLRRCIHTVDPTLSRKEIICLTKALLDGSSSPHRVHVGKVIRILEKL